MSDDLRKQVYWKFSRGVLEPKKSVAPQGSVHYNRDGKQIVVTYFSSEVPIVDSQTGEVLRTLVHPDEVHFARFSPNGSHVVTVDSAGTVHIWDVEAGKETMKLSPESGTAVSSAVFSPDGRQVIGGGVVYGLISTDRCFPARCSEG